jgi:hypothetical protein
VPVDEDSETIIVDVDPDFGSSRRSAGGGGACITCGKELPTKRHKWCDEHHPRNSSAPKSGGRVRGKGGGRKPTEKVERGMNSITGKLLYLLTLFIAWQQLRRLQVVDVNGDLADELAMTDEESELVARPLTRLFLATEPGRKIAPKLVDNEDVIDAIFAFWDWYKRMVEFTDQHAAGHLETPTAPTPINRQPRIRNVTERRNDNGASRPVAQDRSESEGNDLGYVPPGPLDAIYLGG